MAELTETHLDHLSGLVSEASGIQLSPSKRDYVRIRLERRMPELGLKSFREYLNRLRSDPEEKGYLFSLISTNHSFFFREPDHFDLLRDRVFPQLMRRPAAEPIRIWSAAAAQGQEAYSIAMLALETRAALGAERSVEILGTDISVAALDKARAGIYPMTHAKAVSPERRARWFQKGVGQREGTLRVRQEARALVRFEVLNFLEDLPIPSFDVVFLRNAMIYFDRQTQERLVNRVAERILPGGYFLIGHSENLAGLRHPFESLGQTVFRRPAR